MNESNSIECNSLEAIDKTILSKQIKFRVSQIIGIENYFYQEINQRKSCSKELSKYVAAFDYIDKILVVLSATSINYFVYKYCWCTSLNCKCKPYFNFSLTTGLVKKLLNLTKKQKEKT